MLYRSITMIFWLTKGIENKRYIYIVSNLYTRVYQKKLVLIHLQFISVTIFEVPFFDFYKERPQDLTNDS